MPSPVYGQSECYSEKESKRCVITCEEGYALPLSSLQGDLIFDNTSTKFVCNNSDPAWYSSEGEIFPECTVTEVPEEVVQEGEINFYPDGGENIENICNDTNKLLQIENEIFNDLSMQVLDENCEGDCKVIARAVCENSNDSDFEEETNIIVKRHISPMNVEQSLIDKKTKTKGRKIKIRFTAKKRLKERRNQKKFDTEVLKKKLKRTRFLQKNQIGGAFAYKVDRVKIVCPLGFATKKNRCGKKRLG